MVVAVIVVSAAARSGLRRQRALLLFRGPEHKAQNAGNDHKYCCKYGYLHLSRSSGWKSIPR